MSVIVSPVVLIPNVDPLFLNNSQFRLPIPGDRTINVTNPGDWREYVVSVEELEQITGYNFFSEVPEEIRRSIKQNRNDTGTLIADNLLTAPLLTENTEEASIETPSQSNLFSFVISNESTVRESQIPISFYDKTRIESNYPSQINIIHRNLSYTPSQISIPQISNMNAVSRTQLSISQTSPFHIATFNTPFNHDEFIQIRSSEVGVENYRLSQASTLKIGSTEIAISSLVTLKDSSTQISPAEISVFEIDTSQINTPQINTTEVSFPSSVTLQKFFSSHNSPLEITGISSCRLGGAKRNPTLSFELS